MNSYKSMSTTLISCLLLCIACIVFVSESTTSNTRPALSGLSSRKLLALSCWPNCFKRKKKQRQNSKQQPWLSEVHSDSVSEKSPPMGSSAGETRFPNLVRDVGAISTIPIRDIKKGSSYIIGQNTYQMVKILGRGTYGIVLAAKQVIPRSSKLFAVKLQDVTSEENWEAARVEWKVANFIAKYNQKSNEPNNLCDTYQMSTLYSPFGFNGVDGIKTFAMVLPYFANGDLENYQNALKQNHIPPNENRALKEVGLLLKQIGLKALKLLNNEVYSKALYYNDMKPQNILIKLDENHFIEKFVLTDWGLISLGITPSGTGPYLNPMGTSMTEMLLLRNGKRGSLITDEETAGIQKRMKKLAEIIDENPQGIIDIHGLAVVAFEFYSHGCEEVISEMNSKGEIMQVINELCSVAQAYVHKVYVQMKYTRIKGIRERRKLINDVIGIWDSEMFLKDWAKKGIDFKGLCEYKLAKFFETAFNIHESQSEKNKQLTWDYVQQVVNSMDKCTYPVL